MSKKLIIGNWKMNPSSLKEAEKLFFDIAKSISGIKKTEIVICPPFLYLERLKKISKKIALGGQNAFGAESGAYTGEVSAEMLYNIGAKYVILGHSERRALGETNTDVNKKIKAAFSAGLIPILCVGEVERDHNHEYFNFVKEQVKECLNDIPKNLLYKIIIAYEPVWAISTSSNRHDATSGDSREMAIFIRKIISDRLGNQTKMKMPRVIYGGSVNERDAQDFIQNGGVDGLLPGRASLDPKKFSEIVRICEASSK
jgi:triosephosphate isomerase